MPAPVIFCIVRESHRSGRRRPFGMRTGLLKLTICCILCVLVSSSSFAASVTTASSFWKDWNVWSFFRINNSTSHRATNGNADDRHTDEDVFGTASAELTKKRSQFLDSISVIASSLIRKETSVLDPLLNASHIDLDAITPQSDLSLPGRHFHIVTTAALPWFTGTAVNPLLRAAYLHRKTQEINGQNTTHRSRRWVTLIIPWLELPEDQKLLYSGRVFGSAKEQEDYIRDWLRNEADMPDAACPETGLEILFYPGRYHTGLGSIFAMGDIIDTIVHSDNDDSSSLSSTNDTIHTNSTTTNNSNETASTTVSPQRSLDVCILEEPEHCNWYRAPGDGWTKRFHYVVGIVHTSTLSERIYWVLSSIFY